MLGGRGLQKLALINHKRALETQATLRDIDHIDILTDNFFNEFAVRLPCSARALVDDLSEQNVLAGVPASRLSSDNDKKPR